MIGTAKGMKAYASPPQDWQEAGFSGTFNIACPIHPSELDGWRSMLGQAGKIAPLDPGDRWWYIDHVEELVIGARVVVVSHDDDAMMEIAQATLPPDIAALLQALV